MECLCEAAKRYLNRPEGTAATWEEDSDAVALVDCIHTDEIWVKDYNAHIQTVRAKKIDELGISEIHTYLTAIVAKERSWGTFSRFASDGTLDQLLTRYLALCEEDDHHAPCS